MIKPNVWVLLIGLTLVFSNVVCGVELEEKGRTIIPEKTGEVIKIDANLTEETWKKNEISEDFVSFFPTYDEVLPQKTTVWMSYDSENLYFAFMCYDPEPRKIKSTICQRDMMFRDDWVGVMLDAVGTKQTSYEFYVNPNGIQGDALNSSASGTDISPDFVWESAGKLVPEGYRVEMRIPLSSINFKGSKEVRMRMLFVRNVSRLGVAAAWPKIKPGQTDFNFMADVIYKGLQRGLNLQVLPNFVYSSTTQRADNDTWADSETAKNLGVSLKYGLSNTVTAEVTLNPDFSQVESDTFQVEVNRRYPIFYVEKRPFFMEGFKIFDFGLTVINDMQLGMMTEAVHTRRIVDPSWAAKVTGTVGKLNFGVVAADDQKPEQTWGTLAENNQGKDAYWSMARFKYNLGSDNSLGFLYSGSYFGKGRNDTLGLDFQYRLFKDLRVYLTYLRTRTKESSQTPVSSGNGYTATLQYITPAIDSWGLYEHYDEDFNMHSSFINRVGISRGMVYAGPNWYPKIKGMDWLIRIQPYLQYEALHDHNTGMDDSALTAGITFYFTRMGILQPSYHEDKESWLGQTFKQKYTFWWIFGQVFKWMEIQGTLRWGDQLYYDALEPFMGSGKRGNLEFILEPSLKLRLRPEWIFSTLYRKSPREKIYNVNIINFKVTYQFNKYFLVRAALRYNDYEKRLLTDLLASFTLIPGTVVHLGYGSLYENKTWQNNQWVTGPGDLLNTQNSLFFKVSYLWHIK